MDIQDVVVGLTVSERMGKFEGLPAGLGAGARRPLSPALSQSESELADPHSAHGLAARDKRRSERRDNTLTRILSYGERDIGGGAYKPYSWAGEKAGRL